MRKVVFASMLAIGPFVTLMADGIPETDRLIPGHEHRVNFGLLNIGYERIKPDSVYTAFDANVSSILLTEKDNSKSIDHYVNGEVKIGYNHSLTFNDNLIGYGGVGFSIFAVEKQDGKLRNWNYGMLGVKYLHQFGEIFEMGLHFKGHMSISQKRYAAAKVKKVQPELVEETTDETELPILPVIKFQNDKGTGKTNFSAVKVNDTRFVMHIGVPMIWHIGANKNWEIQFEPYYMQIPNEKLTHIIGSNVALGYRY